jgi:hydrogenase maturation protease
VIERLAERGGNGIEVEDVSYHPVGLSQNLQDRPPYDRVVLVGAVARDRAPGAVTSYRWDGELPDPEEIQTRVSEAVTGVISLDNTLIVCGALGGLPDDVRVVEIEPASEDWGEQLSPEIEERLPEIVEAVWTSTRP